MCELLIRTKDKGSDKDAAKDALISKRGHVIAVCPDGWGWTKAEQDNPEWAIVKMPGVAVSDYAALVAPVVKQPLLQGDAPMVTARRAFSLDLSRIAPLASVDGSAKTAPVTLTAATLDAAKVATPVAADIEVIG